MSTSQQDKISRASNLYGATRVKVMGQVRSHVLRLGRARASLPAHCAFQAVVEKDTILRGDLAPISVGFRTHVGQACVLRPCYKRSRDGSVRAPAPPHGWRARVATALPPPSTHPAHVASSFQFQALRIGDGVRIGRGCVIECLSIGTGAHVGENCVVVRAVEWVGGRAGGAWRRIQQGCDRRVPPRLQMKRSVIKEFARVAPGTVVPPDMVVPPFARVEGIPGAHRRAPPPPPPSPAARSPTRCSAHRRIRARLGAGHCGRRCGHRAPRAVAAAERMSSRVPSADSQPSRNILPVSSRNRFNCTFCSSESASTSDSDRLRPNAVCGTRLGSAPPYARLGQRAPGSHALAGHSNESTLAETAQ